VVMRDAKRLVNRKHGVVSVDHTCTQCLHPAAPVAVAGGKWVEAGLLGHSGASVPMMYKE
jgi:hypothetical protein